MISLFLEIQLSFKPFRFVNHPTNNLIQKNDKKRGKKRVNNTNITPFNSDSNNPGTKKTE